MGDKCETMSSKQKTIQNVVSTASIIAIVTIILTYLIIVLNDLVSYFCNKSTKVKKGSQKLKKKTVKLVYVP